MQTEKEIIVTNLEDTTTDKLELEELSTDITADNANSSSHSQAIAPSPLTEKTTIHYPYEVHKNFYNQLAFLVVEHNYKELLTVMLYTPIEVVEYYQQFQQQQKGIENYTLHELAPAFQIDAYTRLLNAVKMLPDTMTADEFVSSHQQTLLTNCGNTAFANALAFLLEKQKEGASKTDNGERLCSLDDDEFAQGLKSATKHRQSLYRGARAIVEMERSQLAEEVAELTKQPLQDNQTFKTMLCKQLSAKILAAEDAQELAFNKRQQLNKELFALKSKMYPADLKINLDVIKQRNGLSPIQKQVNLLLHKLSKSKHWPKVLSSLEQITLPLDILDKYGSTLLHKALESGSLSCARLIMKKQQENLANAADNEAIIDLTTVTNILGQTAVQFAGLDEDSLFVDAALHPDKPMSEFRSDFLSAMRKVLKKYHDKATQLNADINFREKEQVFPAEIDKTLGEIEELEHACQVAELELMDEFLAKVGRMSANLLADVTEVDKRLPTSKRSTLTEVLLHLSPTKVDKARHNTRGHFNAALHREIYALVKRYEKNTLAGHRFYDKHKDKELTISSARVMAELKDHQTEADKQQIMTLTKQVKTLTSDKQQADEKNAALTVTVEKLEGEKTDLTQRLLESQQQVVISNERAVKSDQRAENANKLVVVANKRAEEMANLAIERKETIDVLENDKVRLSNDVKSVNESMQIIQAEMKAMREMMAQFKNPSEKTEKNSQSNDSDNSEKSEKEQEKSDTSTSPRESDKSDKTDEDSVTKNRYSSFKTTPSSSDEGNNAKTSKRPAPDSTLEDEDNNRPKSPGQ